jgi:hypothetical protein
VSKLQDDNLGACIVEVEVEERVSKGGHLQGTVLGILNLCSTQKLSEFIFFARIDNNTIQPT